ncbi:MAG TPA: hypothetical protein VMZ28_14790 [Kofleriaceae bacterium]|nr:hypothetical protein [Kofleriaceae bacterium]
MATYRAVLLALTGLLSACLESRHTPCPGGNIICPAGTECTPDGQRCALPGQMDACDGLADLAACDHPEGDTGYCAGGLCVLAECGNARLEPSESCEPGEPLTDTCMAAGYYGDELLTCSAFCQLDARDCTGRCGDGNVDDDFGELCDGDAPPPGTCLDYGFDRGRLSCRLCGAGLEACGMIGWSSLPPAGTVDLSAADAQADALVVAGDDGASDVVVLVRRDGVWSTLGAWSAPIGGTVDLRDVAVAGDDIFAVGDELHVKQQTGLLLHHDGEAWTEERVADHLFTHVWVSPTGTAFAAGLDGEGATAVFRHLNGAWSAMSVPPGTAPMGLWGSADDDVYLVTTTGGMHLDATWQPFALSAAIGEPRAAHGLGSDELYVAGVDGVARWDGEAWHPIGGTSKASEIDLAGTDETGLFMLDRIAERTPEALVQHWNGERWAALSDDVQSEPRAITVVDGVAHLAGRLGAVERYGGSAFHELPTDAILDRIIALWLEPAEAYAIVGNGLSGILRHHDGATWSAVSLGGDAASTLWGTGGVLFVGTDNGNVHRVEAGAATGAWDLTDVGSVTGIAGTGEDDLYAAVGPSIVRWDGDVWTPMTLPAGTIGVADVSCRPDGECLAITSVVGNQPPRLLRTAGGGAPWTVETAEVTADDRLHAIWASPAGGAAWAVGDAGLLLRRVDGAWEPEASGSVETLEDVWGTGPDDVFAIGSGATLLHRDSQGWVPIRAPVEAGVTLQTITSIGSTIWMGGFELTNPVLLALERTVPWN